MRLCHDWTAAACEVVDSSYLAEGGAHEGASAGRCGLGGDALVLAKQIPHLDRSDAHPHPRVVLIGSNVFGELGDKRLAKAL